MTETLRIQVDWPATPHAGARDLAHISIGVGPRVLTQLADVETGAVRDHFRASAVSLAFWLTDNWWRLRWEPLHENRRPSADWRLRHELTSAAGGTNWPPIMIYGTGGSVVVAPAFGAGTKAGPVRYLDLDGVYTVTGRVFETGVDGFLETVLATCSRAQDGPALATLIAQLNEERADDDAAAWRSLEARLGFDPDDAPAALIERLFDLGDDFGTAAVEEAAVAAPGPDAPTILESAIQASEASEIAVDLSVAEGLDPPSPAMRPWQSAEHAASMVRQMIGLQHEPILSPTLGDLLRTQWAKLKTAPATARALPYGARLTAIRSTQKVALQTQASVDRRFELTRVIGDAIWSSAEKLGVISRSKTDRQKFQRAFAWSLLCPFHSLRRHIDLSDPTESQIESAARYFQVRPSVVRTVLVTKAVLPRETLEERLEAA